MTDIILLMAAAILLTVSNTRVADAEQDAILPATSTTSESAAGAASSSTSTQRSAIVLSTKSVARQGQFPEAAAILVQGQFVCSASIIADDAVITAAVCLGVLPNLKPEEVFVIAGHINRTKGAANIARKIIIHPMFRYYPQQTILEHDIAIIKLKLPFNCSGNGIAKIRLPSKSDKAKNLTNLEGLVTGWGAVALRNKILQHVAVTISSQSECFEFYKMLSPAPYTLQHYQMCSQATEDMCIGESGAGLRVFFDSETAPTLIGIAEPSADCPHPKRPEIYTRVSEYLDWIEESLKM